MLVFQQEKDFHVYVIDPAKVIGIAPVVSEFEMRLSVDYLQVDPGNGPLLAAALPCLRGERYVCWLSSGVEFTPKSLLRMRRCIKDHPDYDVYHWNLEEPERKWKLKTRVDRIFTDVFCKGAAAPLSSMVFRTDTLRSALEGDPEAAGMDLAVILSCARQRPVRTTRWERISWTRPAVPADPSLQEKAIRDRLAFFRWSERFFGKEYPLDTGERLDLFASTLAELYPSYTPDELKEELYGFAVVNGPIRKMKASSAMKAALKARQESLK